MTCRYSTENPVSPTNLALIISPGANPLTLSILIVTSEADAVSAPAIMILPLFNAPNADAFATINCPPTTLTLSFSNTAVDNVPLILQFSNSAVPFPKLSILQPFRLDAKSALSNLPLECMIKPLSPS